MDKEKENVSGFAIPATWREPKNPVDNWYFCCVSFTGVSAKNEHKIVYPNLNSAMRSIPLDSSLPVQEPPENGLAVLEQMECEDGSSDDLYTSEEMT